MLYVLYVFGVMIYLGKNYIYLKMVEIKVGGEVFSF